MEQPEHLLSPPPQEHLLLPHNPRASKKKYIILGVAAGALIGMGVVGYLLYNHYHAKQSPKQATKIETSVTLYYNDGITVLWNNQSPATYSESTEPKVAPYYVNTVRTLLKQRYGEEYYQQGKWSVTTTLDKGIQQTSEEVIAMQQSNLTNSKIDAVGFVAEEVATGKVVALVGNLVANDQAKDTTPNFATQPLQPGSAIKPFVYAAAIENGTNLGAGSQLSDTQGPITGYPCTKPALAPRAGGDCLQNYDRRYAGPVSLRYALGTSRNVPVARLADTLGIAKVQETVKKLGAETGYNCYEDEQLQKLTQCYMSAAIGDGAFLPLEQQVHAYATLSNGGLKVPHAYLLKVTLNDKVKDQWAPAAGEQVVRPDTAYIINDILSDPAASYFSANYKTAFTSNGHKISIKTGTINDNKSGSIIGYGTKYATAFWLGNNPTTLAKAQIISYEVLTIPLLVNWNSVVLKDAPVTVRTKPSDLQTLPAYVNKAHVSIGSVEPSTATDIYPSWYKP
jgi:membrane peptidoglycan carboxypeptidase